MVHIIFFFVEEKPITILKKKKIVLEFSFENSNNLDNFKEICLYCKKPFIVLKSSLSLL